MASAAWVLFAVACRACSDTFSGDVVRDLAWVCLKAYAKVVHRVRVEGLEHVPAWRFGEPPPGPLVVVPNHASGADPLLVQAACPFEVRWMMMRDMMSPNLDRLWEWIGVVPVEKSGRDVAALRTAMRHLKDGGVLGVFAEGGIERPPEMVMPFEPGVGLLVQKTGARVLPVIISGTPRARTAIGGLLRPSRSRVKFLPIRTYAKGGLDAAGIALDLEKLAAAELGWPRAGGT